MTKAALAIGSNMCRHVALTHAVLRLSAVMTGIACSAVYETAPLRADGPDYYNAALVGETDLSLGELFALTKEIEREMGRADWRDPRGNLRSVRCLDIDILLFGGATGRYPELPRSDIWKYPFVAIPLASLEPDLVPPGGSATLGAIAAGMSAAGLRPAPWPDLNGILSGRR